MKATRWVSLTFVTLCLFSTAIGAAAQAVAPQVRVDPTNLGKAKVVGMTPSQIRLAYGFDQITNKGAGQTIAIVSAFDLPTIASDLATFNSAFGLPACTTANGCLVISNAAQTLPPTTFDPALVQAFQLESALDVEWAHAIAPAATIVLVQSADARLGNMREGISTALTFSPSVVSMSWGLNDTATRPDNFVAVGVSFVAASGDFGTPALWPAASPDVTAVGGTKLNTTSRGDYNSEKAWADSGGGLSANYTQGAYQATITPGNPGALRGLPDVSYNADPTTGVAVYSATLGGWSQVGGTSAGAPQWAGLIAIANSLRASASKPALTGANTAIYNALYGGAFNDVTAGPNNGKCGPLCKAGPGYDYLTGLGSPKANVLIPALVGY
jgi:subtilase family serine protease